MMLKTYFILMIGGLCGMAATYLAQGIISLIIMKVSGRK